MQPGHCSVSFGARGGGEKQEENQGIRFSRLFPFLLLLSALKLLVFLSI
jgi:hypothetical protein